MLIVEFSKTFCRVSLGVTRQDSGTMLDYATLIQATH